MADRPSRAGDQPGAAEVEAAILELLDRRAPTGSICPPEVARALRSAAWRPLMEPVRVAAGRLARRGELEVTQRGRTVDPATARAPCARPSGLRVVPGRLGAEAGAARRLSGAAPGSRRGRQRPGRWIR